MEKANYQRPHGVWAHLHEMAKKEKSVETERLVVAYSLERVRRCNGERLLTDRKVSFRCDENVPKLDFGDGCIAL